MQFYHRSHVSNLDPILQQSFGIYGLNWLNLDLFFCQTDLTNLADYSVFYELLYIRCFWKSKFISRYKKSSLDSPMIWSRERLVDDCYVFISSSRRFFSASGSGRPELVCVREFFFLVFLYQPSHYLIIQCSMFAKYYDIYHGLTIETTQKITVTMKLLQR